MPTTSYPHIEIDPSGTARLAESPRITVAQLAGLWLANNWDVREVHRQFPTLTLAQIHSAMAYYYDHEDEVNRAIAEQESSAEEFFRQHPRNGAIEAKIRAAKARR